MKKIQYKVVDPNDNDTIRIIAQWYLTEWNIPLNTTIEKIQALSVANNEFQIAITVDDRLVGTGGIYGHVGLLDKEPRLKIHKNWLALVYTIPDCRGKGLGKLLCEEIQSHAQRLGLSEIFLFTHTAESLYKRLGWDELERLFLGGREIVIMKKTLS